MIAAAAASCGSESEKARPTYFSYGPNELEGIRGEASDHRAAVGDLARCDDLMFESVSRYRHPDTLASRIYASCLVGQRDALQLALATTGRTSIRLRTVTAEVLRVYFPSDQVLEGADSGADGFSKRVAALVASKVRARLEDENRTPASYPLKSGERCWAGPEPRIGIETRGWKPWKLTSAAQFRSPPPPEYGSPDDLAQLDRVRRALSEITEAQKKAVVHWAGGPGTRTPPGQWIQVASDLILEYKMSLMEALEIRALTAMALADGVIAVMESKYHYLVPRPFMRDSSIVTIMPTPNHPSYPAGHGALSGAAATVLGHYFPARKADLMRMAHEASDSRTWGGIHFPVDNERGFEMGSKVGLHALGLSP
jgi:hypothetical protein